MDQGGLNTGSPMDGYSFGCDLIGKTPFFIALSSL
jgi:hypothetical protein